MESKQPDVMAILKLYELRCDEKMRAARAWFLTEFNPTSGADIVKLMFRVSRFAYTTTDYRLLFVCFVLFVSSTRVCSWFYFLKVYRIRKGDIKRGVTFCVCAPSPIIPVVVTHSWN